MASMKEYFQFKKNMKEFPCSFNVGTANLKVGNKEFHSEGFQEPRLQKDIWSYLKNNLEEDVDELDPDLVDPTWKDNLRVRVYAELGEFDKAWELNKEVLKGSPENLVALANSGFLSLLRLHLDEANKTLGKLVALRNSERFYGKKLEAVCEQGYTYYKFSEGDNKTMIETTVEILEYCVENIKENVGNNAGYFEETEKLELMLATMYRRNGNPAFVKNIKTFVEKAVNLFTILKENTNSVSIQSICIVELARLKKNIVENHLEVNIEGDDSIIEALRNHVSVRMISNAGPMFNTYPNLPNVVNLLKEIIAANHQAPQATAQTEQTPQQNALYILAHDYLSGVYFVQAKQIKRRYPKVAHTSSNSEDILIDLLLSLVRQIPAYSEENLLIRRFIETFKQYYTSSVKDVGKLCIGAFRLFQARRYDDAMEVCQKVVNWERTPATFCHIDAHYMMALCNALKFMEATDAELKAKQKDECLDHVISCLRYAAILVAEKEMINIVDHTFLWKDFLEISESVSYHIMDFRMNAFERLQKLVSFFRQALPDLETIILKTEKDWNDVKQIEQELEQLKNTNLNLALLYLSLINLRPETRQRISWRNSHVVRAIKLEAAKDVFTQDGNHDGLVD